MYTPPPQGGGSPLPPVEPRGGWGNWGSGSGTSHLPPSSCGDTVQSGCLLGRLAAQTDWQGQVQVSVHIGLSNGGGLFCHAASGGVAVSVGFGGFATLSMSRTGSGCFSSGNGDVMTTTTTTVQGSSVTPVDTCFSMQCISEGAQGAADKPTDGEEVSAGSGGEELAAFFEGEGNGGSGGKGPGVGGPSDKNSTPVDLYRSGQGGLPENGGHPGLNNLRLGQEFYIDSDTGEEVVPPGYGLSTFTSPTRSGNWWKLPEGTSLPDGLQLINDHGNHYMITPTRQMTIDEYLDLVSQTRNNWQWYMKIK